jgi:hypothetical protein
VALALQLSLQAEACTTELAKNRIAAAANAIDLKDF